MNRDKRENGKERELPAKNRHAVSVLRICFTDSKTDLVRVGSTQMPCTFLRRVRNDLSFVNMAASSEKYLHVVKALEKLSSVPPFWPNKAFNFKVRGFQVETVVKAISSFETATKFLFYLQEIPDFAERFNADNIGSIQPIEITDEASDCFYYNIVIVNNKPLVELDYVRKANLSVPQLHVDIEKGEIIDNALRQYFGFTSFRLLQRETIMATMSGKDVMTVVGTGGGKTLMYLLPANFHQDHVGYFSNNIPH